MLCTLPEKMTEINIDITELDSRELHALERMRKEYLNADFPEKDDPNGRFRLDDRTFLRFLRARDFNFKQAKSMLDEHLAFRRKWKPETISLLKEDELRNLFERDGGFWRFAGFSRNGSPIQYIDIGRYKPEYFPSVESYTRLIVYQNEIVRKYFHSVGYKVDKNLVFYDLSEFSYLRHGTPKALMFIKAFGNVLLDQYPEQLEYGVLYGAPRLFDIVWMFIRKLLDQRTANKVRFVHSLEELHQYIAPDQLYEKYGGTRKEEYPPTIE